MNSTISIPEYQRQQLETQFILSLQKLAEAWGATLDLGSFHHLTSQNHEQD
ncbi:MAG: hypothetical protein O3A80_04535 [bacterium]|nr:hypothetical protein [bacterium]